MRSKPWVRPAPPEARKVALATRSCKGCGQSLADGTGAPLYCSARCRAVVWRRGRQRVGLGPRAGR